MSRTISTLTGTRRKVDGVTLFGHAPRLKWAQWMTPDRDNNVEIASRALLVQQDGKNILVLAGTDTLLAPMPRTCRCQPSVFGLGRKQPKAVNPICFKSRTVHFRVTKHRMMVTRKQYRCSIRMAFCCLFGSWRWSGNQASNTRPATSARRCAGSFVQDADLIECGGDSRKVFSIVGW